MLNPNLNKRENTLINRLHIGYTRLTHGYLMAEDDKPIYNTCGTKITCQTYYLYRMLTILKRSQHPRRSIRTKHQQRYTTF